MLMPPRRTRGLTLIELLVSMTVLGLLMMVGIPGIGAWLRNAQIRTAAESMQAGLQKARSEAVRRNQVVYFSLVSSSNPGALGADCALSSTSASWVVSQADPTGLCHLAASETVAPRIIDKYTRGDGAPNVSITASQSEDCTGSSATQVSFNGYGQLSSTTTTPIRCVQITHNTASSDNHPLRIAIGSGGTLRMCDPVVIDKSDPRVCNPN